MNMDKLFEMSYFILMKFRYIPLVFKVMKVLNRIRINFSRMLIWELRRDILVYHHKRTVSDVLGMFVRLLGYSIPKETPQQLDVELEAALLTCMKTHYCYPKQVLRVLLTLLSKKYVHITVSNVNIIEKFLTAFADFWFDFHPYKDLALVEGLVECLHNIYMDYRDDGEIVNRMTSRFLIGTLFDMWRTNAVLIMDKHFIIRILSVIAVHDNKNARFLLRLKILDCISKFYDQYKNMDPYPQYDLIVLMWALMPNLTDEYIVRVNEKKNQENDKSYEWNTWHKVIGGQSTFPFTPKVSSFLQVTSQNQVVDNVLIIDDNKVCQVNVKDKTMINFATMMTTELIVKKSDISILHLKKTKRYSPKELPREYVKYVYRFIHSRLETFFPKEKDLLMETLHTLISSLSDRQRNELLFKIYKEETQEEIQGHEETRRDHQDQGNLLGAAEDLSAEQQVFNRNEAEAPLLVAIDLPVEQEAFNREEAEPPVLEAVEDLYVDQEAFNREEAEAPILVAIDLPVEQEESNQVETEEIDVEQEDFNQVIIEAEQSVVERTGVQEVQTDENDLLYDVDEDYFYDPTAVTSNSLIEKLFGQIVFSETDVVNTTYEALICSSLFRLYYHPEPYGEECVKQCSLSRLLDASRISGIMAECRAEYELIVQEQRPLIESASSNNTVSQNSKATAYFREKRKQFVETTPNNLFTHSELVRLVHMLLNEVGENMNQFFYVFLDVEKIGDEEVVSAEPFRKFVEKLLDLARYHYELKGSKYPWPQEMTTDEIFFAGVHTIRYISMKTIHILFMDSDRREIVRDEIYPFTSIEYLEHYMYETHYANEKNIHYQFKEWINSSNKVKLYMNDIELPSKITLYEAINKYGFVKDEIYTTQYVIFLKKVDISQEPEDDVTKERDPLWDDLKYRKFFDSAYGDTVLLILALLYRMNRFGSRLFKPLDRETLIDKKEFVFPQLDKSVAKTLFDPFSALTGNYPEWIVEIVKSYPFLFSFDTRKMAFEVLVTDRLRAATAVFDRHKIFYETFTLDDRYPLVNINKKYVLDQVKNALKQTRPYSHWNTTYDSQMGSGVGVEQDVCTTVAESLMQADLNLWAASKDEVTNSGYLRTEAGLYPDLNLGERGKYDSHFNECSQDMKFEIIGTFMAKAILDRRIFPLPLSQTVFKWLTQEEMELCVDDLKYVDPSYYRLLKIIQDKDDESKIRNSSPDLNWTRALINRIPQESLLTSIEDFCLTFVLPRHEIELIPDGMNFLVTNESATYYSYKMVDSILKSGVRDSMIAMRRGFNRIIKLEYLLMLEPSELLGMTCGAEDSQFWTFDHFIANIELSKFPVNCPTVLDTFDIISKMTIEEKRRFLHFVTGCPYLPPKGFAGLEPRLHIARLDRHKSPFVQTCFNKIYLPAGIKKEKLRKFYYLGITEGYQSFGLA
ncbi:uncharacterized protein LOC123678408 [Harmonia axyridis]|uniref:uncharacterized protein LOC123678408 n=1 Tax=Harmonia axyridis TaxID=115357 RepID=UPI001E278B0C|nr:uncharacterized protein LOC123678408 [Harmonia axyridis]XP_045471379.1 uncharacterized protein LOC123678408 [Harmonia axyridis]